MSTWPGLFLGVQEHVSWWTHVVGFTNQNFPPWGQSCTLILSVSKWFQLPILNQCVRNLSNKDESYSNQHSATFTILKSYLQQRRHNETFASSEAPPDQALLRLLPKYAMCLKMEGALVHASFWESQLSRALETHLSTSGYCWSDFHEKYPVVNNDLSAIQHLKRQESLDFPSVQNQVTIGVAQTTAWACTTYEVKISNTRSIQAAWFF